MPTVRFDDGGDDGYAFKQPREQPSYNVFGDNGGGFGVPTDQRSPNIYEQGGITGGYRNQVQPNAQQGPQIGAGGGYDYAGVDSNGKNLYRDAQGNTFTDGQGLNGFIPYANPGTAQPGGGGLPSLNGRSMDDAAILAYINSWANQLGADPSLKNDPNYWVRRIKETGGLGSDNTGYWHNASVGDTAFFRNPNREGGGAGVNGAHVFDDPATKQWETVLQGLAGQMAQPFTPQGFGPLQDYLQKYFQQLQGPAYTPEQTALMNTQAVEPLTQERDAQRQRLMQNFSQRGIGPNSGIAQDQMNQLDRQYEQLRSVRERDLAVGAVNQQNQNRQQAAQVGSQIAGLQTQLQAANEARALHGLGLLKEIPQMADSRLQLALGSLGQNNPNAGALFGNLAQFNQQAQNQQTNNQNYWNQIGQLVASIFM